MRFDQRQRREHAGDRVAPARERDAAENERNERKRNDLPGIEQDVARGQRERERGKSSGIRTRHKPPIAASNAATIATASIDARQRKIQSRREHERREVIRREGAREPLAAGSRR